MNEREVMSTNSFIDGDNQFNDIFNLEEIQMFQNLFSEVTGVGSIINLLDGTRVTKPSNLSMLCTLIRKTEKGLSNCIKTNEFFNASNQSEPVIQTCLNCGLSVAGVGISNGNNHLANWLVCQVRTGDLNKKKLIESANIIGVNKSDFIKAYKQLPVISPERFKNIVDLLFVNANLLSQKANRNLKTQSKDHVISDSSSLWQAERLIFQHGKVVIFKWKNTDNWPIEYVSPNIEYILGYDQDEVSSPAFSYLSSIHPEDLERVKLEVETNLKLRNEYFEHKPYRLIRKDGEVRWVSDFTRIQIDKNGLATNYVGYIVDITEHRYAEESLLQEHELFHEILNNQPAGIYRLRVFPLDKWEKNAWANANHPPYILELTNNRFCEILETNRDVLQIKPGIISELIHEEDIEDFKINNEEANEKLLPFKWEGRLQFGNRVKWIHIESQPFPLLNGDILWTGFINDVTERKLAEQTLSIEKRKLADIIRGTNVGCWEWNLKTGETVYNERWAEIIGYTLDEISPVNFDTWLKFTHPEDLKRANECLENHLKGESEYYTCEVRMKHKSGDWIWVFTSGRICDWDKEGKPTLISGTHLDITERKQIEENLKNSQEHLKKFASHLQKVQEEERTHLATEIHDELGQILVALRMDIGMLKQKALTGNVNTNSDELVKKLDNAYGIIGNSIRTTMKIMTDLRYEVLHLLGFVEACKLYSNEFQEKNNIKCVFESSYSNLELDSQFSVILFRILQDAMNNIELHSKATEVKIYLYQQLDKFILEINDNGIGFDTNVTDNQESFGIINMKERAFLLKGELNITSKPGNGTNIRFEMPYSNQNN